METKDKINLMVLMIILGTITVFTVCKDVSGNNHVHKFVWAKTIDSTCMAKGLETGTCECGVTSTRDIEKDSNAHNFNWTITISSTCLVKGTESGTCACGETSTRELETDSNAHNFNWIQTTDSTCMAKGIETGTCECGETATRDGTEIDSNAHDYQWISNQIDNIENETCIHNNMHTRGMRFEDSRDNQIYKVVKIGTQIWLAENLNYNAAGSLYYNNDQANNEKYGRLYDWETALNVAPVGWHLPNEEEWNTLMVTVGGDGTGNRRGAAIFLKSLNGWNDNGNGTNEFGFSALPGGYCDSYGSFSGIGNNGSWWCENDSSNTYALSFEMGHQSNNVIRSNYNKLSFLSIRCLLD